jgi:hypothetical protein
LKQSNFDKAQKALVKADKYSIGADLMFCKAAYCLLTDAKEKAIQIMEEALQENFLMHSILVELVPSILHDRELNSMIEYYRAESIS